MIENTRPPLPKARLFSCGFDSIPSDLGSFFGIRKLGLIKRANSQLQGRCVRRHAETIFSIGDLDLKDELADPFLLNPPDSYNAEMHAKSRDRLKLRKMEIGGWGGPFVMAAANTRVVRRSAALLSQRQEPYGSNLSIRNLPLTHRAVKPSERARPVQALVVIRLGVSASAIEKLGEGPTEPNAQWLV